MTKKQKEQELRIQQEQERLMKLFESATQAEKDIAFHSIQNLAFMTVQLQDLQQDIMKNGAVEKYNNGGGQSGNKSSSAMQAYNNLIKSYNTTLKILAKDIFKNIEPVEKDALQEFMEKYS